MDRAKPRFKASPLAAKMKFRKALSDWFARVGKDYPWRRTREPYPILVSEMMLQQTQIATVLGKGYYTRFLAKFPDLESLARADDESLLKAWEGLGYYRRARMLRETARAILANHNGIFPMKKRLYLICLASVLTRPRHLWHLLLENHPAWLMETFPEYFHASW